MNGKKKKKNKILNKAGISETYSHSNDMNIVVVKYKKKLKKYAKKFHVNFAHKE